MNEPSQDPELAAIAAELKRTAAYAIEPAFKGALRADLLAQMQQSDLLTVQEVAQLLRVDDTTVRRWIKSGALQAIKLPTRRGSYRVRRSVIDKILA
jgi:excisionase family DNA binding protein